MSIIKAGSGFTAGAENVCMTNLQHRGTLFHKCKLGLMHAFEMAFRISVRKKGMSSCELGKEFDCQQKSAWLLKAKLQEAMKSSEQHDLKGHVEIDEFMVGGFETRAPGRTHGEKSLVVLAVEKVIDKKGNENLGRALEFDTLS